MESARLPLTCLLCNEDVGLQSRSHQSRLRSGSQQPPDPLVTDGLSGQILTPAGPKVFWWQLSVHESSSVFRCDGYSIFMDSNLLPCHSQGSVTLLPPFQYFLSTCWLSCLEFKTSSYVHIFPLRLPPTSFLKSSLCFIRPSAGRARCCSLQLGIVFCSPPGPGTRRTTETATPRAFFLQAPGKLYLVTSTP